MKIALGSAFRNSSSRRQLPVYLSQAADLQEVLADLGHSLYWVAVEGDSTDDTREQIDDALGIVIKDGVRIGHNHGQRWFGSTEEPERMKALQGVGNSILKGVPNDANVLVYVESDLLWDSETILGLISRLCTDVDVVAPLIFAGELFYDIFAFRKSGKRFIPFPPYHDELLQGGVTEIDSAGSCLVMKAEVAHYCRIGEEEGLVSFCADARRKGYRIWADSERIVRHP